MIKSLLKKITKRLKKRRFIKEIIKGMLFYGNDGELHKLVSINDKYAVGVGSRTHRMSRYDLGVVHIIRGNHKVNLGNISLFSPF